MDEWKRNQVPAFGSWDCSNDVLPFTQCFESATRQANGLIRHSYTYSQQEEEDEEEEGRDLYVAGDLYANDVLTPAMILVPRRTNNNKQVKEERKEDWVKGDYDYDYDYDELKEPPSPMALSQASAPAPRQAPKPVDEDLYRISPELLFAKSKRKRAWGFFSSCCLVPTCVL